MSEVPLYHARGHRRFEEGEDSVNQLWKPHILEPRAWMPTACPCSEFSPRMGARLPHLDAVSPPPRKKRYTAREV